MFKKYFLLLSIILLSACAGTKKIVTETKEKVETQTITEEVKLDTTIFIPSEEAMLFIPIKDFHKKTFSKPKLHKKKKGRSSVTLKIDSTGIKATSSCDSIFKKLDFYKITIKELKTEIRDIKSTSKEQKGYTILQLLFYMIGAGAVSFILAIVLNKFKIL